MKFMKQGLSCFMKVFICVQTVMFNQNDTICKTGIYSFYLVTSPYIILITEVDDFVLTVADRIFKVGNDAFLFTEKYFYPLIFLS